jgi:hypothetical protein
MKPTAIRFFCDLAKALTANHAVEFMATLVMIGLIQITETMRR